MSDSSYEDKLKNINSKPERDQNSFDFIIFKVKPLSLTITRQRIRFSFCVREELDSEDSVEWDIIILFLLCLIPHFVF